MTARPGSQRDRGSGEVLGLVLFFPAMIGLAVMVLWLGRRVDAGAQVRAASDAAAQAAARQRNPSAGVSAARSVAAKMLRDTQCDGGARVSIDAGGWQPGGRVSVTVTCTPTRRDMGLLGPNRVVMRATSVATIDRYRASP